ncbi:MAG TPA: hypothetical protein VIJ14_08545 [Rhabdochlamydiaceae bacterium]
MSKKPSHLLFYVENCSSKVQRFQSKKKLKSFIAKFLKKYPIDESMNTGYWVDQAVFDVYGDIVFITDDYNVIE